MFPKIVFDLLPNLGARGDSGILGGHVTLSVVDNRPFETINQISFTTQETKIQTGKSHCTPFEKHSTYCFLVVCRGFKVFFFFMSQIKSTEI